MNDIYGGDLQQECIDIQEHRVYHKNPRAPASKIGLAFLAAHYVLSLDAFGLILKAQKSPEKSHLLTNAVGIGIYVIQR